MPTEILLIRHGETDWNVHRRIQGHRPTGLNARGLAQAQALAKRLCDRPFAAIYSSDLPRARQTAEAIAAPRGHQIHLDSRLREWDLGVLSGLTAQEAQRSQPEALRLYRERIVDTTIPGGESIRQRFRRVTDTVQEIAERHPESTVVCVSHGGPLGDCYRQALGVGAESRVKPDLFNAAINQIHIDSNGWTLGTWADTDHLAELGALGNWEARR